MKGAWDRIGWGGGKGENESGAGHGGQGKGGVVKLQLIFKKPGRSRVIQARP